MLPLKLKWFVLAYNECVMYKGRRVGQRMQVLEEDDRESISVIFLFA